MFNTYIKPSSELRNKYPEISRLVDEHNQVIITSNGQADKVLISMDEYKKYEEFLHLRYVDEKLAEAEVRAEDPNTKWFDHDEFWNKVNVLALKPCFKILAKLSDTTCRTIRHDVLIYEN